MYSSSLILNASEEDLSVPFLEGRFVVADFDGLLVFAVASCLEHEDVVSLVDSLAFAVLDTERKELILFNYKNIGILY